MRIYRVEHLFDDGISAGYAYYATLAEAVRAAQEYMAASSPEVRAGSNLTTIELQFKPTRAGLLEVLNRLAAHPNNG